jgi:hypothetical protein
LGFIKSVAVNDKAIWIIRGPNGSFAISHSQ